MEENINWLCPYCEHHVTISASRRTGHRVHSSVASRNGMLGMDITFTICPNGDCALTTVEAELFSWEWLMEGPARGRNPTEILGTWRLKPWGKARTFPEYVPEAVRADYEEAHSILGLSPKAAATLARRALQGIVRDYWKVKPGRLYDELNALEQVVDPDTWQSLDAVRQLGNIGAHPERDINLIVDIEPGEAELLLGVVETLIDDTYIARRKREDHRAKVAELLQKKKPPASKP